jgi:hypothetical protein
MQVRKGDTMKTKHFKFFHEFLKECAKARKENKTYWVNYQDGKYILNVVC